MYGLEETCMELMPGTTLHDLDDTDTDTLFGYIGYKIRKKRAPSGSVMTVGGKQYRKTNADRAGWL